MLIQSFPHSNKRLVLPWSLQASHERSLEKSGKRYKFGSYKYSARKLYDRGVLLSIDQHSPKQFSKISLVISSNDVGVFEVKAEFLGMPATTVELKLEDLLESQFVGSFPFHLFPLPSSGSTSANDDPSCSPRRRSASKPSTSATSPSAPFPFSSTSSTASTFTFRSLPSSAFLDAPVLILSSSQVLRVALASLQFLPAFVFLPPLP